MALSSFTTFIGGLEEVGRMEKAAMSLPPQIKVERIGPAQTLAAMLESGEIDALFTPRAPSSFIRGTGSVRRLFEDGRLAIDNNRAERLRSATLFNTTLNPTPHQVSRTGFVERILGS